MGVREAGGNFVMDLVLSCLLKSGIIFVRNGTFHAFDSCHLASFAGNTERSSWKLGVISKRNQLIIM